MDIDGLKAKIKSGSVAGAYLFYGDEAYMKDHYVSQLRKTVLSAPVPEFNYSVYEADKLDTEKLAEEAYMLPLMADYKMAEIQAVSVSSLTGAVSASLADIISDLPEYFMLLFTVRSGEDEEKAIEKKDASPFVAAMRDYGNIVKFEAESGNKLLTWMNRHFTAGGTPADRAVLENMVTVCGNDMYLLAGEIKKLCAYCGSRQATVQDVEKVCCANESYKVYDLSRAVIDGDMVRAGKIFASLRFASADPIMILGALSKTFSDMLLTLEGLNSGKSYSAIASDLKSYDFVIKRYAAVASKRGSKFLANAVSVCAAADKHLKSFRGDPYTVLETAVYRIGAVNAGKN